MRAKADSSAERLRRWQYVTAATLLVGYTGYYLCRSNLSVAAPLMMHPIHSIYSIYSLLYDTSRPLH